jgi:hypothetical protein
MNRFPMIALLAGGALLQSPLVPVARADAWNKKTIVDFSRPVEVPGAVLQPGKYVMKLVESQSDRHIVQFSNERENKVYATVLAIPAYRLQPTGKTVITFYEMPGGQPEAMRTWFYPGDNFGQEFAYPKRRAEQLMQTTSSNVPTAPVATQESTLKSRDPEPTPTEPPPQAIEEKPTPQPEVALNTPAPTPEPQPQAEPQPTPTPAPVAERPARMPSTASEFPLAGLVGLFSILAALAVRSFANRMA